PRRIGPAILLADRADPAPDLKAPRRDTLMEAQDAERNAKLGRPTPRAACDLALPDFVPVGADLGVVVSQTVDEHTGRADLEVKGGGPVVTGVEIDRDAVAVDVAIATRQSNHRLRGLRAVDRDVEIVVVVGDANAGRIRRMLAVVRKRLRELFRSR